MSHRVLIKRGLSKDLHKAGITEGELKYATDTNRLYIGNGYENVEIGSGGTIYLDKYDELPRVDLAEVDKLYYCKDIKVYFYVREINGDYRFYTYSCSRNQTFNQTSSANYQYVISEDKFYKASYDMDGYDYVTVTTSTPENPSQYENGMYVVCRGSSKLYRIDSTEDAGYVEVPNFVYSYYSQMTPATATVGKFFYYRGNDKVYFIKAITWEEFYPYVVETLPKSDKRYVGKYFYNGYSMYQCEEYQKGTLTWQEIKTDVDLDRIKEEVQAMLSSKLQVEEYEYMTPEASAETMGKLYMWKDANVYMLTIKNETAVNTIATVTKQEETSSSSGSSQSGSTSSGDDDEPIEIILDDDFANDEPYMEGLYADIPDASWSSCSCYYATDLNKYYIRMATSGGFLSYYWSEVNMHIQSYKPSSSSEEGYYKVVSGNTTTIYQVVTYYSWVNLVEDRRPNVQVRKVAGQWGYDNFKLTNLSFDYEEISLSSMNTGYIYGVIEDA